MNYAGLIFGLWLLAGCILGSGAASIVWMEACARSYRNGYDAGYEDGRIVGRLGGYETGYDAGYEAYRNVKEVKQ